jgi:putative DNA primase/helicase
MSSLAIDLRTGIGREPRREDYFTKHAAAKPGGDCPLWLAFLDRVTDGDHELQAYLKRVAGYCLTGLTSEQVLFFLYGTGANGKSVFVNTLTGIWGSYAVTAPMETFVESPTDRHPTELAHLRGARLVVAHETERGRRWAESKIKALTGGDRITARFMRGDFFEYMPQFKLMIVGNHKPALSSVDEAIRRRIHLVPFTVTIPPTERDHHLAEKLRAEWDGILQWAIDGCLEWQKFGSLAPPAAVRAATDNYLADEDTFARWLDECCVTGRHRWGGGNLLWSSWKAWSERNNERTGSRKAFAQAMLDRGFTAGKSQQIRGYSGVELRPERDDRADLR